MKSKILVPVLLENIDMVVNGGVICTGKNLVGIQWEWKVFRPAYIFHNLQDEALYQNPKQIIFSPQGEQPWQANLGGHRDVTLFIYLKKDGQEAGL